MESGNPVSYRDFHNSSYFQDQFDDVVSSAGCTGTADALDCLRQVPFATLNAVLNNSDYTWFPYYDGDLNQRPGSQQLQDGSFVKVPIIDGANSDEGTAFGPSSVNTTQELIDDMTSGSHTPELFHPFPNLVI